MLISTIFRTSLIKNIPSTLHLSISLHQNFNSINKPSNYFNKHSTKSIKQQNDLNQNKLKPLFDNSENKEIKIQKNDDDLREIDQSKELSKKKNYKEKQNKQFAFFFQLTQQEKLNTITQYKQKVMIKQLSILARQMLFERQKSQVVWCAVQEAFIQFLAPTQDSQKIRSISKLLYALGKSKKASRNYETHMALLLPHSSHQSFTQIVVTLSRMGGMSEEFCHIVQKLYWKRRQEFNVLELLLLNYVLVKNGRKIDSNLIQDLNSFPLRGIALTLKIYDRAGLMTTQILKKCINPIIARKNQTNLYDFKHIINIYYPNLLKYFDEQYRILARNIHDETLEEIWTYIPLALNANKLPISFVQELIKSIKILKAKNRLGHKIWKNMVASFQKIENLQVRVKLQKL